MSEMHELCDAEAVIDAATRAAEPHPVTPGTAYSVLVSEGAQLEQFDTEHMLDQPRRKRGTVLLRTAASLIQYVGVHDAHDGRSSLFADSIDLRVVAVLNGPNAKDPGWGDCRADLHLTTTPEWQRWMGRNGVIGEQVAFAEHIEDCLANIAEPPGADLLELAQNFEATTSAEFKTAQRLHDGQVQVAYVETIAARAGQAGQLTIPLEFTVVLAPFEGTEAKPITARLRYRLSGGQLKIGYVLNRPDVVLREAFDAVLVEIENATGLTPLHGTVA